MSNCAICNIEVDEQFPARCLKCSTILCDECATKNKFLCKTCRGDVNGSKTNKFNIQKIRRSYIELYKKCPHSFYLTVCKGVESHNSVYAQIGIWLHEVFDACSKGGYFGRISTHEIKNELIQRWTDFFKNIPSKDFDGCQRLLTSEEFRDQQFEKGLTNIDGFITLCSDMPTPWKSEETIEITIPNTSIKATMTFDRINKYGDIYELLDYKTGKVYVGQKLVTDMQPALYIAGVEQTYGIKISKFTFLFTGEGKERHYERITDDIFMTKVGKKEYSFSVSDKLREVSELFNRIERDDFKIPDDLHPWHCSNQCEMFKVGACMGKFQGQWSMV